MPKCSNCCCYCNCCGSCQCCLHCRCLATILHVKYDFHSHVGIIDVIHGQPERAALTVSPPWLHPLARVHLGYIHWHASTLAASTRAAPCTHAARQLQRYFNASLRQRPESIEFAAIVPVVLQLQIHNVRVTRVPSCVSS